jgi:alpha-L-fucosidase
VDRRRFITSLVGATSATSFCGSGKLAYSKLLDPSHTLALPTPDQIAWQDLEIGMFIHFAPNTWQDKQNDNLSTPLSEINPEQLDTDQWVATAIDLGAKYVVFVVKHVGGFCMWQTDTTSYSIGHTAWRGGHGDVLADLAESCRKTGIKLGLYISPRDDNFGAGNGGRCHNPALQDAYNALYRRQLTEVLSRYGTMAEIWFDGSNVVPVADILREHAPHSMIFQGPSATIRWVGTEDGFAPYPAWNSVTPSDAKTGVATALHGDPNGTEWMPIEVDVSILRPNWFWSTTNEHYLLSLESMLDIYYRSVGRGAQLLLNIPPNKNGLMPSADRARAKEFGDEIKRRFSQSVAETTGTGNTIHLPIPRDSKIDHIILQEDCSLGERVRAYRLEAHVNHDWVAVGTGSAIGHKRIQPIDPVVVDGLRLIVTESIGRPKIRRLAALNTNSMPPATWNLAARSSASDKVGSWDNYTFNVDLTKKIASANQYRLRFVPQGDLGTCRVEIENPVLSLEGVPQPKLVQRVKGSPDVLILNLPGIGQKVTIQGQVTCAKSGVLLLQQL